MSKNIAQGHQPKTTPEAVLGTMFDMIAAEGDKQTILELEHKFLSKGNPTRDVIKTAALRPFYTRLLTMHEYFRITPAVQVDWLNKCMFKPAGEVCSSQTLSNCFLLINLSLDASHYHTPNGRQISFSASSP
jgi:hypothetical protein